MSNTGLNDGYGEPTREDKPTIVYEDIYEDNNEKKKRIKSNKEVKHYNEKQPNTPNLKEFIGYLAIIITTARTTYYSFNTNVVLPITTYRRLKTERESLEEEKNKLITKKNQGQEKKSIFRFFYLQLIVG